MCLSNGIIYGMIVTMTAIERAALVQLSIIYSQVFFRWSMILSRSIKLNAFIASILILFLHSAGSSVGE